MTDLEILFKKSEQICYTSSMKKIDQLMKRTAFFPGGKGIFNNDGKLQGRPVMILGQDFGCEGDLGKSMLQTEEDISKNPTWKNLLPFLDEIQIKKEECFFTNAFMGVRAGEKATGRSTGFKDQEFLKSCQDFFLEQIKVQKPKAILVLGKYTAEFLSSLSDELEFWTKIKNFRSVDSCERQVMTGITFKNGIKSNLVLLLHPSFRTINLRHRKYKESKGNMAEIKMCLDVVNI